jgi:hypothetical protein
MKIDREDLEHRFENISDTELIRRLESKGLTQIAHDVATAELQKRGLTITHLPTPQEELKFFNQTEDLVQVARLLTATEAHILQARLIAEGVSAVVADAHHAQAHYFMALAIGGVRILVPKSQVNAALEVKAAMAKGEYALEEQGDNSDMSNNKNELKGLNGWLILVGIGVLIMPVRLLISGIKIFKPILDKDVWAALTTIGSAAYNPLWAPLLIGEVFYNVLMFGSSLVLVYSFFFKRSYFPKLFIVVAITSLLITVFDAWVVTIILPNESLFDADTTQAVRRNLMTSIVWVPYMLLSKRVKATFTESTLRSS